MLIRLFLIISLFVFSSCSFFKKDDLSNKEKFELGISYFSKKKFQKAKDTFEFLVQNEAGNLGVESNFHLAMVLFELEEYDQASYHFNYYSTFSKNIENVELSQFMKCKCAFEMCESYTKDQTNSLFAISIIQEFLDTFPYSLYKEDAYEMINDLRNRLSKKYYEAGRLYIKMKKFNSAFYYFDIVMSEYYDTDYFDEALISYIFTYIVMKDYDEAEKYFDSNKGKFRSSEKQNEAEQMLIDHKKRLGLSGLYRLYK
tara:strand:- start:214 stop:984 length:771 start_codon:yes stop_codon:yes gene_type:complete